MAEIKRISEDEFNDIASRLKFDRVKLTKDYFITVLLYLIKDINGAYFKGGIAINKIFCYFYSQRKLARLLYRSKICIYNNS